MGIGAVKGLPALIKSKRIDKVLAFHGAHLWCSIFHHNRAVQLATGIKMSFGKYIRIGERGFNCKKIKMENIDVLK